MGVFTGEQKLTTAPGSHAHWNYLNKQSNYLTNKPSTIHAGVGGGFTVQLTAAAEGSPPPCVFNFRTYNNQNIQSRVETFLFAMLRACSPVLFSCTHKQGWLARENIVKTLKGKL